MWALALALLLCSVEPLFAADPLRIVLPAQPAPPEQFAADELVKYLVQMGNSKPHVISSPAEGDIYVGTMPGGVTLAPLRGEDADGFIIRSEDGKLLLHGNSPRATLYAAYHYLESLGARWYFPGRENEVIPRANARLT